MRSSVSYRKSPYFFSLIALVDDLLLENPRPIANINHNLYKIVYITINENNDFSDMQIESFAQMLSQTPILVSLSLDSDIRSSQIIMKIDNSNSHSFSLSSNNLTAFPAAIVNTSDLSGKYIGYGYDPFVNQDYQMEVLVTKTQTTYQFETVDETNREIYIGTGVFDPKDPSNLAVVYRYPNGQDVTVGQYKVQADGSIKVTWAMLGENYTATETLRKITPQNDQANSDDALAKSKETSFELDANVNDDVIRSLKFENTHLVDMNDLSGKYIGYGYDPFVNEDYQMEVLVTKTQNTYQFRTVDETNGEIYIGTGVSDPKDPSNLAVVYKYPNGQDVTVGQYKVQDDGSIKVTWAILGENHTATETLKKLNTQKSSANAEVLKLEYVLSDALLQSDLLPDVQSQIDGTSVSPALPFVHVDPIAVIEQPIAFS